MADDLPILLDPVTVLRGHDSPETAYVQDDYPNGRYERVKRRLWLETATKGQKKGDMRWCYQTTKPRDPGTWLKPHTSQYSGLIWMHNDPRHEPGRIAFTHHNMYDGPATLAAIKLRGIDTQMTDAERRRHAAFIIWSQRSNSDWEKAGRFICDLAALHAAGEPFPDRNGEVFVLGYAVHTEDRYAIFQRWVQLHGDQPLV